MSAERAIRIGVSWRTAAEESAGRREKLQPYLEAVGAAGGQPVELSLAWPRAKLDEVARELDGFVLPGSPADVDPQWYHTARRAECHAADPARERADFALLDHAFAARKPVLAVCYGIQSLNVFCRGTLVQDITSELPPAEKHHWDRASGEPEPHHAIRIEPQTELARLAGTEQARVNSSHHQAIARVGSGLRVAATAPDGVVEAVELVPTNGGAVHWVLGVQWHPERMAGDALARALFSGLTAAARRTRN